jgi:hypothetical protein
MPSSQLAERSAAQPATAKRFGLRLDCVTMHREILCLAFVLGWQLQAATYYVDAGKGLDSNSGTTEKAPWQSLSKVNATKFQAGDRILFVSGGVWRGQLAPTSSGSEGKPIVFDRYGKGALPRIDAAGEVEDAVLLRNVQQIEVRNLELVNHGPAPAPRRGVHIFLEDFGTAKHIVVADLYIHDVNGTNKVKDNGGIIFRTQGSTTPSRFDGLTIERNIVWQVDRSAIAAESYHASRNHWFPSVNVVIRDNFVDDIGGDGIVPWATDKALIEHNIARDCNRRAGSYNAGIWPWSTDNSLFQLNEAALTRNIKDGQGFDSDYNSHNTIFQYNYGHDNEGGFMLICSPSERNEFNIGNKGTVVRHNISRNDKLRTFTVSAVEQTTVEDNAIYIGAGLDVQLLMLVDWQGWADDAVFRGNTFYVDGTARYGHEVGRPEDGLYQIGPGYGPAKRISFVGNRYFGKNHIDRPEDPKAVTEESGKRPALDWNAPQFDPKNPAGFQKFMTAHRQWIVKLMEAQFGKDLKLGW